MTDLCSLSISCKHFNRLSNDDTLWSTLRTLHFPHQVHSSSFSNKTLYKYLLLARFRRGLAVVRSIISRQIRSGRFYKRSELQLNERAMGVEMDKQTEEGVQVLLNRYKNRYSLCQRRVAGYKFTLERFKRKITTITESMESDDEFNASSVVGKGMGVLDDEGNIRYYGDYSESSSD